MAWEALKERERAPLRRFVIPVRETVSGSDPFIVSGATGAAAPAEGFDWISPVSVTASVGLSFAQLIYSGQIEEQYNPEFVASVLRADAEPPEASFNNVVDMLEWLNRD